MLKIQKNKNYDGIEFDTIDIGDCIRASEHIRDMNETNYNVGFKKDGVVENIEHQEEVIEGIKERLYVLFHEVYHGGEYDYISEKRTYKPEDIVETLEELIHNDITTGEGDRANLKEATSDNPSLEHFTRNHKLIRKANESCIW